MTHRDLIATPLESGGNGSHKPQHNKCNYANNSKLHLLTFNL